MQYRPAFSACTSFTWRNSPKETIADIQLLKMAEELEKEESTDFSEKEKPEKEKPEKERVEQISEKEEKQNFPSQKAGKEKKKRRKKIHPK